MEQIGALGKFFPPPGDEMPQSETPANAQRDMLMDHFSNLIYVPYLLSCGKVLR